METIIDGITSTTPGSKMATHPSLIVDLHTHFFNARCLPLAGIIANALDKDASESRLARATARLLNRLTESDYKTTSSFVNTDSVEFFINELCNLAVYEVEAPLRDNMLSESLNDDSFVAKSDALAMEQVKKDGLYSSLVELETILVEDGWLEAPEALLGAHDLKSWTRRIVAATFRTLEKLIVLRDEIENYAEFFFNILTAEKRMVHTLSEGYGKDLPPIQFVHYMMDMQMAYINESTPAKMVEPAYRFYDTQLLRMQDLARQSKGRVFGFSAFDPRRDNWREIVDMSISKGFKGFKFYPAMGYLPIGNRDPKVEGNVLDFFRFCIEKDVPIFTHCTPVGFETRLKLGMNADPRNWENLLDSNGGEFAKLRLCFGHAGGGRARNSAGWDATGAEWTEPNNFATTVVRLCRKYENVYCELAYITDLIKGSQADRIAALRRLEENLQLAAKGQEGENYDLMRKVAYGSDWHMPSMVDHPREYLNVFLDLFGDGRPLSKYREDFFWKNAYAYMKV